MAIDQSTLANLKHFREGSFNCGFTIYPDSRYSGLGHHLLIECGGGQREVKSTPYPEGSITTLIESSSIARWKASLMFANWNLSDISG